MHILNTKWFMLNSKAGKKVSICFHLFIKSIAHKENEFNEF